MIHSGLMGMFIHCCTANSGQHVEFGLLQTGQLKAVIAQHSRIPEKISRVANNPDTQLCFQRWGSSAQTTRYTTDSDESAQLWALLQQAERTPKPTNQNVAMPGAPHAAHIIELGVRFMAAPRAHTAQWFEQQVNTIHGFLSRKSQDQTPLESQSAVHFARANYQLNKHQLPEFMKFIERLQQDFPQLKLQATGPWPPYSFPTLWAQDQANS